MCQQSSNIFGPACAHWASIWQSVSSIAWVWCLPPGWRYWPGIGKSIWPAHRCPYCWWCYSILWYRRAHSGWSPATISTVPSSDWNVWPVSMAVTWRRRNSTSFGAIVKWHAKCRAALTRSMPHCWTCSRRRACARIRWFYSSNRKRSVRILVYDSVYLFYFLFTLQYGHHTVLRRCVA